MRPVLLLALVLAPLQQATQPGTGQLERPRFDVVSIKPCRPQDAATGEEFLRMLSVTAPYGNRYHQTCTTVPQLASFAYDLPRARLRFPDWIRLEFFEIDARAAAPVGIDVMRLMVRNLLAERFALRGHTESAVLDSYSLVVARQDGSLGPNVRPSAVDCSRDVAGDEKALPRCGLKHGITRGGVLTTEYTGMTMAQFAQSLPRIPGSSAQGYVVVDRTDVRGTFDFTLTVDVYEFGETSGSTGLRSDATLFGALENQLGLRLAKSTGPVDVFVIDDVERPTSN